MHLVEIGKRLNLVNELLEKAIGGSGLLRRYQTIDDEQRGIVLLHHATNERDERVEPTRLESAVAADVVDALGNRAFIEKGHSPQMREHPGVRFREQRDVHGALSVAPLDESTSGWRGWSCHLRAAPATM